LYQKSAVKALIFKFTSPYILEAQQSYQVTAPHAFKFTA